MTNVKSLCKQIATPFIAAARMMKEVFWTFAGLMVMNSYIENKIIIATWIWTGIIISLTFYHHLNVTWSMKDK